MNGPMINAPDDPRLPAMLRAIEQDSIRRPACPANADAPGPQFRYVHVPDAPPGQEVRIEEIKPPPGPSLGRWCAAVSFGLLVALVIGWPAWSMLINLVMNLWEDAHAN